MKLTVPATMQNAAIGRGTSQLRRGAHDRNTLSSDATFLAGNVDLVHPGCLAYEVRCECSCPVSALGLLVASLPQLW